MKVIRAGLVALVAMQGPPIKDGKQLLRAMHDRYGGKWYHTVVFVQDNTLYNADGSVQGHSKWDHHFSLPGKLRIDFEPLAAGNGVLLRNDSQYVFQAGKLQNAGPRLFSLLLLAFDVYLLPPDTTVARIGRLQFDLSKLRENKWQGRAVYVIGDDRRQFWVDRENLYTVRVIEADSVHSRDVQFNKYRRLGDGWIAPQVAMYQDGKPVRLEEYLDPKVDLPVDPRLFDPQRLTAPSPAAPAPAGNRD